jgi:hypothetical protein
LPPFNNTADPVICPPALRFNTPEDAEIILGPISKPPICPAVFAVIVLATMSPVILAADAVI